MNKIRRSTYVKKHIDKRLQFRFRLYFIIAIILLCIVGYNFIRGDLSLLLTLLTLGIGLCAGIISARMYQLSWNHDGQKIVSRLDGLGGVILILYILFALLRDKLLAMFVAAPSIGAATFAIIAGIMMGRVIGTRGKIVHILKEQEII